MDSKVYYCCVFDGKTKIQSYNKRKDQILETMADHYLENAPPHHSWFFHTVKRTTYGLLMERGFTYLVIVDSTIVNPYLLNFLRYLRDGFRKLSDSRGNLNMKRLMVSLENTPRDTCIEDMMKIAADAAVMASQEGGNSPGEAPSVPLLGDAIAMPANGTTATTPAAFRLQKNSTSVHSRSTQLSMEAGRVAWFRLVKLVVAVDLFMCLLLFGIWLFICDGFNCLGT
ncbi:hypothetical protein ZOSMA_304G00100 [Zostera marina]|uniref:Longin domain-containing protein n=1 Tax=Zostera marina TaxID=29655 RepID=A0A0K9PAD9_ZOSMR|nr:hypothetical protein ZOSMA_304G00100 [Zostera marina]